jgi:hypothetical protein
VKQDGQWRFDTEGGEEEILNRRIGANELGAIQVCRAYVQAQREYASVDRNAMKCSNTPSICAAPRVLTMVSTGPGARAMNSVP